MSFLAVLPDKHYLGPLEWNCLDWKLSLFLSGEVGGAWASRKDAPVWLQTKPPHFPSTSSLYLCFFVDVPHEGQRVVGQLLDVLHCVEVLFAVS